MWKDLLAFIQLLYLCSNLPHIQALTNDLKLIVKVFSVALPTCSKIVVNDLSSSLNINSDFFYTFSVNNWEILTHQINNTRPKKQVIRVRKLHLPQHRAQCVVVLMSIFSASEKSNQFWEGTFTMANTEKDFFVFHTRHEMLKNILLNQKIMDRVKFKLGVSLRSSQNEPVMASSVCFYCKNGKAAVVDINITKVLVDPLNEHKTNKADSVFPNYVKNFYGRKLRISYGSQANWLVEIRLEKGIWVPKRGVYNLAIKELMRRLNFTGKFFPSFPNGEAGLRLPNGTWIGAVGDVLAGRADFAPAIAQVYPRNLVVDFTSFLTCESLSFTTGKQSSDSFLSWKGIYRPFTTEAWIFIAFSSLLMGLAFKVLNKLSTTLGINRQFSVLIFNLIFKSLLDQHNSILNKPIPTYFRILCSFWLFFVIIVSTAYKSKLFVFLMFLNVDCPPNSFQSLSESGYRISHYHTDSSYTLFNTSTNPAFMKIFKSMVNEPSDSKCLKAVLVEKNACISWANVVDYVAHKNMSRKRRNKLLVKAPESTWFVPGGIAMSKLTIYKQEFRDYIRKALDSGILLKWRMDDNTFVDEERRSWERENSSVNFVSESETELADELTFSQLNFSFYMLILGSAMALGLFLFEKSTSTCRPVCKILV
jgi:hypothetical protein